MKQQHKEKYTEADTDIFYPPDLFIFDELVEDLTNKIAQGKSNAFFKHEETPFQRNTLWDSFPFYHF
ncbi:hypothetical protein [Rossellomorea sp. LJF3]|uniref:hypothetical protein n=1 Tax=Rossellomorea sp. LJF3 TaxID=3126099 RepID=UPI00300C656D